MRRRLPFGKNQCVYRFATTRLPSRVGLEPTACRCQITICVRLSNSLVCLTGLEPACHLRPGVLSPSWLPITAQTHNLVPLTGVEPATPCGSLRSERSDFSKLSTGGMIGSGSRIRTYELWLMRPAGTARLPHPATDFCALIFQSARLVAFTHQQDPVQQRQALATSDDALFAGGSSCKEPRVRFALPNRYLVPATTSDFKSIGTTTT